MKQYIISFAQWLPNFGVAELESLAQMAGFSVDLGAYDPASPFIVVQLESDVQAGSLVHRSVLAKGI